MNIRLRRKNKTVVVFFGERHIIETFWHIVKPNTKQEPRRKHRSRHNRPAALLFNADRKCTVRVCELTMELIVCLMNYK